MHIPIFVQKAHDASSFLIIVVLFVDLTSFGDLAGIVLPSDRVHAPKACSGLISPFFLQALFSMHGNQAFSFIVRRIFRQFLKIVEVKFVQNIVKRWGRWG